MGIEKLRNTVIFCGIICLNCFSKICSIFINGAVDSLGLYSSRIGSLRINRRGFILVC